MRVTIKPHNRTYIDKIAAQMEITDKSEVINYLILELKRLGYSFNAQITVHQASHQSRQPELEYTNQFDAVSIPNIPSDSLPTPSEELDPIISRLAELVDTF